MNFLRAIPPSAVACGRALQDFCSMKITEDVRKYAAQQLVSDEQASSGGTEEKAREFTKAGGEVNITP
jgi:phosphomethylpyrimidine synthase